MTPNIHLQQGDKMAKISVQSLKGTILPRYRKRVQFSIEPEMDDYFDQVVEFQRARNPHKKCDRSKVLEDAFDMLLKKLQQDGFKLR